MRIHDTLVTVGILTRIYRRVRAVQKSSVGLNRDHNTKWDPRGIHPCDYENNTYNEHKARARDIGEGLVPFDKRVTTNGHIGEVFRIFTTGTVCNDRVMTDEETNLGETLTVATDGSCLRNGRADATAGAGVYFGVNDPRNLSVRLPPNIPQSNQTGETIASLLATKSAPENILLIQETDSETVMKSVTTWRKKHEDAGYVLQKNASETRALVSALRERKAATLFRWVKGHDGHEGNEMADRLAGEGARKTEADSVDTSIPQCWKVSGSKLSNITQKIAYQAIRQVKEKDLKKRARTEDHMGKILDSLKVGFDIQVTTEAVWNSLRTKNVSRECRQFMWMTIHDGYMVGDKWLRPKMTDEQRARAQCGRCGVIETMEHILFECAAEGRETVWELVEETWEHTGLPWIEPSWGSALGAGCATFPTDTGEERASASALWSILMTESLYFIWKLRCERVISQEGREFTIQEVSRRWYAMIDRRLDLDRRACAKYLGPAALKAATIARIWEPVVHSSGELPPNWVTESGFLVGIKRGR